MRRTVLVLAVLAAAVCPPVAGRAEGEGGPDAAAVDAAVVPTPVVFDGFGLE